MGKCICNINKSVIFELVGLSNISFQVGQRGTVRDYPGFSPSVDAEAIRKAIRGIGEWCFIIPLFMLKQVRLYFKLQK